MNIGFILPSCPLSPSGGAKVVYDYANYLSEQNNNVTIYFMMDRFMQRRRIPLSVKHLLSRYIVKTQPQWYDLDPSINKKTVFYESDIDEEDVIVATALATSKLLNRVNKAKEKYYFIQGFENWECSDAEVFQTYQYDMEKIVIAKWLEKIVEQYSNNPVHYVTNGVDTKTFKLKKSNSDRPLHSVVFHYRRGEHKGCKYAIETIKEIKGRYSDLIVNIISVEERDETIPSFCNYYKNIKPDAVADILNDSNVFICSSISEGFGLPGLEAMACGCAVASSAFPGVLEYAEDRVNALLSPVEDSHNMTKNVIELFENEQLRNALIQEGINTANMRSVSKSARRFASILLKE